MSIGPFSFNRQHRIVDAESYKQLFQTGRRIRHLGCTLIYKNNNKKYSRLGLAVSKKQIPKAFQRNLIKRLILEGFRKRKSHIISLDVVLVIYNKFKGMDKKESNEALNQLWMKLEHKLKA